MTKPFIALLNKSTAWSNAGIAAFLPALQEQITHHFAPAWGVDADLGFFVDPTAPIPATAWPVVILDHSDQAGALGYHDLTNDGRPIGFSFAGDDLRYGEDLRTTLAHEVLELLADPYCRNLASVTYDGKRVKTICEVCDAVEDQAYIVNDQVTTNFVLPAFFDTMSDHPPGTKFDYLGKLKAPMTLSWGGYLSIFDESDGQGWRQVFGSRVPIHKKLPPRGSRRERFLLRENHHRPWQASWATI